MLNFNLFLRFSMQLMLIATALAACNTPAPTPTENLSMVEKDHQWILVDQQNQPHYEVYFFDNGPDYPAEGLYRIVKNGKIGYAAETTNKIVIAPQYDCAFPFENGKAKVSNQCTIIKEGEYSRWESANWQHIDKQGNITK